MSDFYDSELVLETERLILRPLAVSDAADFYRLLASDPEVTRYYVLEGIESAEDPRIARILEGFARREQYGFALRDKRTDAFLGIIHQCGGMNPYFPNVEIGYALGRAYWNQGYMTEALQAFIDLLFRKGVHKVFASHIRENAASGRVMRKCGMLPEGERKAELFYKGKYHDFCCYYRLNPGENTEARA